jgi:hypothetical protein
MQQIFDNSLKKARNKKMKGFILSELIRLRENMVITN